MASSRNVSSRERHPRASQREADTSKRSSATVSRRTSSRQRPQQPQGSKRESMMHSSASAGRKSQFVPEPIDENFEDILDHYKVGNWGNRNTYLPALEWASESPTLFARFKALVEARNMDQIRILLHAGVSPNLLIFPNKRTALHHATEMGDELLCQMLLSFKADPMLEDDTVAYGVGEMAHMTARDIARKNQQLQLVHLFNAHLGKEELLDVGPDAGPLRSDKPLRIHLKAYEPGFMNTR